MERTMIDDNVLRPGRLLFTTAILCLLLPFNGYSRAPIALYSAPESFLYDEAENTYFISNVNGSPSAKDNNGYIVRLNADLKPLEPKFIGGGKGGVTLNAPKGMAIVAGRLFVTDINHVRVFDKKTARSLKNISLKKFGAKFLNDVAADDKGRIYVSDTAGNAIFRIEIADGKDTVTQWKKSDELGGPNGLVYDRTEEHLVVVCFGSGRILRLDQQGNIVQQIDKGLKQLDGVDLDSEGNLIFSSFGSGKIYRLDRQGRLEIIAENLKTPADISVDRKHDRVLVPLMSVDSINTIKLGKKTAQPD